MQTTPEIRAFCNAIIVEIANKKLSLYPLGGQHYAEACKQVYKLYPSRSEFGRVHSLVFLPMTADMCLLVHSPPFFPSPFLCWLFCFLGE